MKSLNSIGKTIVIVTHDRTVAEKCRRIVELSDGEIISDKTIAVNHKYNKKPSISD
jgi:putative ABC transport system ATP-binding protein